MRSGKLKSSNDWREVRTLKQAATLFNVDQPTAMCAWVKKFLCKDDKMSPHSRVHIHFIAKGSDFSSVAGDNGIMKSSSQY